MYAVIDEFLKPFGIHVAHSEISYLSPVLEPLELEGGVHHAGNREIPPVELNEIEGLSSHPHEGSVHDPLDIFPVDRREHALVGNEFRVDLDVLLPVVSDFL